MFVASRLLLLSVLTLGLGFSSVIQSDAEARGAVRSKHGEWELRCDTPPGARNEHCALIQYVRASDRDNIALTVVIIRTVDKKSTLLRVIAPLGVLLPRHLGLRIDNEDVGTAPFVRCLASGCIAEVVTDPQLLEKLRTSQTATFIIFQTPEEGIGIPIDLNGFADGFTQLSSQ